MTQARLRVWGGGVLACGWGVKELGVIPVFVVVGFLCGLFLPITKNRLKINI